MDQCGLEFCLQTRASEHCSRPQVISQLCCTACSFYSCSGSCLSVSSLLQLPQWFLVLSPFCTWILSHCCMCLCTLRFVYTHQSVGHLCFLAAAHSAAMIMGVQMALWYTDFIWRGGTCYLWLYPVEELLDPTVIPVLVFEQSVFHSGRWVFFSSSDPHQTFFIIAS